MTIKVSDQTLVTEWHGSEAGKNIAERLGVSEDWLIAHWRKLKDRELIPDRRRFHADTATRVRDPNDVDMGECLRQWRDARDATDELLSRLRRAHPERI